nr:B3 domain-containing protein At1g10455-like [Ipomoea batatas]
MSEKRLSSEPISPQRSTEDDDLLERSTKKTKVQSGSMGGTTSEDIAGSTQTGDLQSEAELDMVAETPLDMVAKAPLDTLPEQDPAESAMQIELENVSPIENDPAIADGTEEVIPKAVEGGARPKSYLNSVVGQGTDAAPFLVDNFNGSADSGGSCPTFQAEATIQQPAAPMATEGEQGPNLDVQRQINNLGGNSTGRGVASRARPYGPWMIVTRADRRPAGRPPGQNISTGPNKGNQNAIGSRFAPLDGNDNNESVQGDGNNAAPKMRKSQNTYVLPLMDMESCRACQNRDGLRVKI